MGLYVRLFFLAISRTAYFGYFWLLSSLGHFPIKLFDLFIIVVFTIHHSIYEVISARACVSF